MYAVIFEVYPTKDGKEEWLNSFLFNLSTKDCYCINMIKTYKDSYCYFDDEELCDDFKQMKYKFIECYKALTKYYSDIIELSDYYKLRKQSILYLESN